MNKERELLREIYADLEYDSKLPLWLRDRVRDCLSTHSDDAEEPVEFKFIPTGKELLRYHPDEDCIETKVEFANYPTGSKFYPPKPAEPAARKPMTEEEISKLFPTMPTEYEAGFKAGIRYAEKHHGIGGSDDTRTADE